MKLIKTAGTDTLHLTLMFVALHSCGKNVQLHCSSRTSASVNPKPVTVIDDVENLFKSNKVQDAFNEDGVNALLSW